MTERGQPDPYRFQGERMSLGQLWTMLAETAGVPSDADLRMSGDRVYLVGPAAIVSFPRSLADDAVWDVGADFKRETHAP